MNLETITTLQGTLELFFAVFQMVGASVFIYLMVALIKDKLPMYTPHVAIAMGSVLGLIIMIALNGFDLLSIVAGVIHGALLGSAAIGFHVAGNKPKPEEKVEEEPVVEDKPLDVDRVKTLIETLEKE